MNSNDLELALTRIINAPRAKLFRPWIEAALLKQWFAPKPSTPAWQPSAHPFMTGILTFEELGGGRIKHTARVLHWTVADREKHAQMGFQQGWEPCTDPLESLVSTL